MLIQTSIQKILELFFKYPTKGFTIREIGRILDISPPTVSSNVSKLTKKELLKMEKEKIQYKVYSNIENENFRELKRIYNLYSLSELKNFLTREIRPKTIIVYGSYSRGEDREDSDLDIFIDTQVKKEIDLKKFEGKLVRKIHLIIKEFKKVPDDLKKNIINGIILYGVIEC